MPVIPFKDKTPVIGENVFIAPDAWVIGDVTIGDNSSIFFGSVLRGDINPIVVGERTNIQEHVVVHTSRGLGPCVLGDEVTVGHSAVLHGCVVHNGALIGMNATVLDEAIIHEGALVAAQSLVRMGTVIPENMMAAGVPAKVLRAVNEKERAFTKSGVEHYVKVSQEYRKVLAIT